MFLNESFIKLYEELSELNESKADTQKLIDFAGEATANRFLAIKNRLKAPENDLYYWIKNKTPDELEAYLDQVENTKSNTQMKKEVDQGAELVCDTEHWSVYHITTFEASQKYGRDSKWCITGINDWGDKYWNQYTENGIDFYFLITKGEYDPRGTKSKFAIAINKEQNYCEVFNQQDTQIPLSKIPYIDEVKLPTANLVDLFNKIVCFECEDIIEEADAYYGPHEECYCKDCFDQLYFRCVGCSKIDYADLTYFEDEHENKFCSKCMSRKSLLNSATKGLWIKIESDKPYRYFEIVAASEIQLARNIYQIIPSLPQDALANTVIEILDTQTGEVVFDCEGVDKDTCNDIYYKLKSHEALTEWLDSSGTKIDTSTPLAPITTSTTTAKTSGNLYVVFNYYRPNDLDDFCLLHVDASKSVTIDALIEMAEQSVENYGRYKNTLVCYKIDPDEFDMTDDDFIEAAESKHDYCGEGLHHEYTDVVYTLSHLAANEKPLYKLNRSLVEIEYYDEFLSKNSHLVGFTMNDIYDSNFDSNLISRVYNDTAFQKFMKDRLTKTITNAL